MHRETQEIFMNKKISKQHAFRAGPWIQPALVGAPRRDVSLATAHPRVDTASNTRSPRGESRTNLSAGAAELELMHAPLEGDPRVIPKRVSLAPGRPRGLRPPRRSLARRRLHDSTTQQPQSGKGSGPVAAGHAPSASRSTARAASGRSTRPPTPSRATSRSRASRPRPPS